MENLNRGCLAEHDMKNDGCGSGGRTSEIEPLFTAANIISLRVFGYTFDGLLKTAGVTNDVIILK